MVVLGGGPIGCELTQAFARLGVQVTQIEMLPRLLLREDAEISTLVQEKFVAEGVEVLTGHAAKRFFRRDGQSYVVAESESGSVEIEFDALIVAVGRAARTEGFGLEEMGVQSAPEPYHRGQRIPANQHSRPFTPVVT